MKKSLPATLLAIALLIGVLVAAAQLAQAAGPPDIQKKVFVHFEKPREQGVGPPPGKGGGDSEKGFYKLISGGVRWPAESLPVKIEVNLAGSGFEGLDADEDGILDALEAIGLAAEEWDDGDYSITVGGSWSGVDVNLFDDQIVLTSKGYEDLAWDSSKLDGANTLVWGDYPTEGVIAVTILWYNVKTKEILEFDIVFDTDYVWSLDGEPGKMDLQNIATHELGHGLGLDDLTQSKASEETMYAYSDYGEVKKRDLYLGDQEGITKLYS